MSDDKGQSVIAILDEIFNDNIACRQRRRDVRAVLQRFADEVKVWGAKNWVKRFSVRVRPGYISMDLVPLKDPFAFSVLLGRGLWFSCRMGPHSTYPFQVVVPGCGKLPDMAHAIDDASALEQWLPVLLRSPVTRLRMAEFLQPTSAKPKA